MLKTNNLNLTSVVTDHRGARSALSWTRTAIDHCNVVLRDVARKKEVRKEREKRKREEGREEEEDLLWFGK